MRFLSPLQTRDADPVLDRHRSEVDRHFVGGVEAVGDLVAVEDESDARVVESRRDRQLDDALELAAIRLRVAAQDDLLSLRAVTRRR